MVIFYMKGETLSWFNWMYKNHQLSDWIYFIRALKLHFGPSTYVNHQVELFKLWQCDIVTEYQTTFEKRCNSVFDLTLKMILNYFISGLIPEIHREIVVLPPTSITHALGLTKLLESKINDSKHYPSRPSFHVIQKPP